VVRRRDPGVLEDGVAVPPTRRVGLISSGDREIALVWTGAPRQFDGIDGYARGLARALDDVPGFRCRISTLAGARGADIMLVQYNPFSWGPRGFAPQLPAWMARSRPDRRLLATMIHEPFVAPTDLRTTVMAAWQRPQLALIKALSDRVLAPSADAARRARGWGQRIPVVPVGSNLPDRRGGRAAARERLGLGDGDLVLVTFERSGAGRLHAHVAAAVEAAREVASVHLLVLGAGAKSPPDLHPSVSVRVAGPLPDDEVALRLAASDVFLANYEDGLSTRRTSLVAALQHGLPVVGTTVGRTDDLLLRCDGIVAVPAHDVLGYASAVRSLAAGHEERSRRGDAARSLFEEHFDWAVVARRVLQVIGRGP
jgi:glycosyltransferase involved in cell wall biosynthesis